MLASAGSLPASADATATTETTDAPDLLSTLRLAELLPNPDATLSQREFVELWNPTNGTIDLAGWKLRDAPTTSGSTNEYTFASGRLAAGARIVVWSNGSADARGPSWSSSAGKAVWNDGGDAATLLDPTGAVIDWLPYGNSAMAPPAGFEGQVKPAAPARGLSIALDGGAWSAGAPTPALAPGTVGAIAEAVVQNIAPSANLNEVPASARPGQAITVTLGMADDNGLADIRSWTLAAGGATVAQGTTPSSSVVALTTPAYSGPWTLELLVTDAGGLTGLASATVQVRDGRLAVTLPGGMLRFPQLQPGDAEVAALDWATLRNEGNDLATPLLDVSPFAGPAGEIPVDGNLHIGLRQDGGNATWTPYTGPLLALPALAPGATLQFTLRLDAVPVPLAAGAYGTTFALVAA